MVVEEVFSRCPDGALSGTGSGREGLLIMGPGASRTACRPFREPLSAIGGPSFFNQVPAGAVLLLIVLAFLPYPGVIFGAEPPSSVPAGTAPPPSPADTTNPDLPFASEIGQFGLSLLFQYNVLQTPAPTLLFQNGVGGDGELSYGLARGIRVLAGTGYLENSPNLSPPRSEISTPKNGGPSNQYLQAYLGGELELTRWFPEMIRYQPWFPYVRADMGGVFSSVSNAGSQDGHPDGLMGDVGLGIEGRPRALPMAFFGEIRPQWIFFGPQIVTVVPVLVGTTFYF